MKSGANFTDWASMGLGSARGFNAFTSVVPRGVTPPVTTPVKSPKKKNKTKVEQAVMALETPEERKARQEAEILRQNKYSDVGRNNPHHIDRTNQITGRRLAARFQ